MREGVIVKVRQDYSVLMAEGKFHKIKNRGHMIQGMSVLCTDDDLYVAEETVTVSKRSWSIPRLGLAVAMMAVVLMVSGVYYDFNYSTYGVVTMDINPSIALHFNRDGEVLKLEAMNADGEDFTSLPVEGLLVEEALALVIDGAESLGYVSDDHPTMVALTKVSMRKSAGEVLDTITVEELEEDMDELIVVLVAEGTEEDLEEARESDRPLALVALDDTLETENIGSVKELIESEAIVEELREAGVIQDNGRHLGVDFTKDLEQLIEEFEAFESEDEEVLAYLERAREALEAGAVKDINLKKEGMELLRLHRKKDKPTKTEEATETTAGSSETGEERSEELTTETEKQQENASSAKDNKGQSKKSEKVTKEKNTKKSVTESEGSTTVPTTTVMTTTTNELTTAVVETDEEDGKAAKAAENDDSGEDEDSEDEDSDKDEDSEDEDSDKDDDSEDDDSDEDEDSEDDDSDEDEDSEDKDSDKDDEESDEDDEESDEDDEESDDDDEDSDDDDEVSDEDGEDSDDDDEDSDDDDEDSDDDDEDSDEDED